MVQCTSMGLGVTDNPCVVKAAGSLLFILVLAKYYHVCSGMKVCVCVCHMSKTSERVFVIFLKATNSFVCKQWCTTCVYITHTENGS